MENSTNSFERYRVGRVDYRPNDQIVAFQRPSTYFNRMHHYPDDNELNYHVKIIINESSNPINTYDDYKKIQDSEYTKFVSLPNGKVRISAYKMIKNNQAERLTKPVNKVNYFNRPIYLPNSETYRSESNNEVLFRKSFKPCSHETTSLSSALSDGYSSFTDESEKLPEEKVTIEKNVFEDELKSIFSSTADLKNLEEEQKDYIIKLLSKIAKSKADSHVSKNKACKEF